MNEFAEKLRQIKQKGLLRKLTFIKSRSGSRISINGQTYINFSSNDYLGLSAHPEIVNAAITAIKRYGFGSGASRLLSGSYIPHKRLEERIARFKEDDVALVFNTGYAANVGIIPTLVSEEDTIFSDELNHASIIDGIKLSKARVKIFRHRDMNYLEGLLKKSSGKKLIITDTVFSMDGDIAPLKDIFYLCRKYGSMLMIDDAHATGVIGRTGRGGLEYFGINADDIIQMGTLSKAFGCFGAFVVGRNDLIEFLVNRARSFIYSTSLPPAVAQAAIKAIDIVEFKSDRLRKRLWENRKRLYEGLKNLGCNTLSSETPIIPILTGDIKRTLRLSSYLYRNRIFAPAIRPPSVPEGMCRIRFSVTAVHTDEDIDFVLKVLKRFRDV